MTNPNISQLVTSTLENYKNELTDNITDFHPLYKKLKDKGNIIKESGGSLFREKLLYRENDTIQYQGEYDLLDTTPQDVMTSADFQQKILTGTVTMSMKEMRQNAGKEKLIDLMMGKMKALEAGLKNELGRAVYNDGTESNGQAIAGLQLLVADDAATGTVGGIDRANYSFWRNQEYDFSDNSVSTPTSDNMKTAMNELYNSCQAQAGELPDLALADNAYYNLYQDSLQTIQRITSSENGQLGFEGIKYKNIDVYYDPQCPAEHMYFLNCDYLFLKHLGEMFNKEETTRVPNQLVYVTPVSFLGNMTLSNARVHGVIKA